MYIKNLCNNLYAENILIYQIENFDFRIQIKHLKETFVYHVMLYDLMAFIVERSKKGKNGKDEKEGGRLFSLPFDFDKGMMMFLI